MSASKRGYKTCPTRLLNAQKIEQKVIELLRTLTSMPKLDDKVWDTFSLEDKITIIKTVLKEVSYDGNKGILEIVLLEDNKRRQYQVELKELKNLPVLPNQIDIRKEPQLRQNLILAHQVQCILNEKKAKGLKQVAEWLNLNHQRLNQMMNLLLLSPTIQEEIICSDNMNVLLIPEYKLRDIAFELNWKKQLEMWQDLLKNPSL
jgi:hypothetical protein